MKRLREDMSNEELYSNAFKRAKMMGALDDVDVIIFLEDEIRKYRERLSRYEIEIDKLNTEIQSKISHIKELEGKVQNWQKFWDEQPKIGGTLNTSSADDETVITVRSKRKVDSIDLYFQEG